MHCDGQPDHKIVHLSVPQHEKPPMTVKKVLVVSHRDDLKKLKLHEVEEWIKSRGFSSGAVNRRQLGSKWAKLYFMEPASDLKST
jgi:hypothetical protein